MKHAFVTGGTGFLGMNLIEQLTEQGWQVTAMHRKQSNIEPLKRFGVQFVESTLHEPERLQEVIPTKVDAVFHVAANISMWRARRKQQFLDNVIGTRNMVNAACANEAGVFVHTSTWATYEHSDAITEQSPQVGPHAKRHYARTKYMAEQEVKDGMRKGLKAVIMNPAHIIGAYDRSGWSRMIRMVHEGTLPGVPPGSGAFAHARQVALAHIKAADLAIAGDIAPGEHYLLGGVNASFLEVIQTIGQLTQRPVPSRAVPGVVLRAKALLNDVQAMRDQKEPDLTPEGALGVIGQHQITSSKAKDELGFEAISLREIFGDAHQWMVEQGMLT